MAKSRFSQEPMVPNVYESGAGGVPATAKKHGISNQTLRELIRRPRARCR
jgi:hypothetical protein